MKFRSIKPEALRIPELHSYLLAAVAPRAIALASTIDSQGNVNLSPFSFFNAFSSNPPIMVFSPSRRGRDGTTKDTYDNIKEVPEAVINVVTYSIVEQVSLSSSEYPSKTNEFLKAGLHEVASQKVRPPRVEESPVAFECTVDDVMELGDQGGAGNLVVCRVAMIHINEDFLDKDSNLDTTGLDLVGRMGANWYTRAFGQSLFEVGKPMHPLGIGIDKLPFHAQNSNILSGNNLGKLGNLSGVPDETSLRALLEDPIVDSLWKNITEQPDRLDELHKLAKEWIEQEKVEMALKLLFITEIGA